MRPQRLVLLGLACLSASTLAACGQASRGEVLSQAAQALPRVRSGSLDLRMAVSGGDAGQSGQVGFEERGPFSLPNPGGLPVANTEVIHFVGTQRESTRFISTGQDAFIGTGGQTYALPPARVQALRQASTPVGGNLGGLPLDRWAVGGSVSDGGQLDGVATDHVVSSVNVVQFVNDLMQLSRGLGQAASVPQVNAAEAQTLSRAVRSSHFEMWSGKDDHMVRKLVVSVDFAAPADPSGGLAKYSRSHLELDLALTSVNQQVRVDAPKGAQPFSAFCTTQPEAGACKNTQS